MEGGVGLQLPEPRPRSRSPVARGVKKPVPLPRRSVMDANKTTANLNGLIDGAGSSSSINSSGSEDKRNNDSRLRSGSVIEETLTKGYNTLTKSLKKEMKSASGCVQEKGKAVIEGTKNVSVRLEKSVRGILTKRNCASVVYPSPPNDQPKSYERCQSLPGEEIFSSISFDSPMSVDGGSVKNESLSTTSDDLEESAPPPFPPPPLPDESLYDEVSIRSGQSGSGGHSYENYTLPSIMENRPHNDAYYEELPIMKKLSMFQDSDSEGSFNNDTLKSSKGNVKNVKRSGSWSFYDSVDIPPRPHSEAYENVMLKDRVNFSSASNIYSELPTGNVVVLGGVGKQETNKLTSTGDRSSTSSSDEYSVSASQPDSLASSFSVANELYDNWSPSPQKRKTNEEEDARIRARNRRLYPSKSVILEFDPLYENIPYSALKENEENEENESVHDEQSEQSAEDCEMYSEGSIPIPVPPERFDSITTLSQSPKNIPNDVEYYLYHRKKENSGDVVKENSPVGSPKVVVVTESEEKDAEDVDSRSLSESPEREGSPGKRKASNLVRWTSMKRAIKAVADGSNWSPGVMRRISKSNQKLDQEPLKQQDLDRPVPDPSSSRIHGGFVFRSSSGGEKSRDFVQKWCQLSEGKLTFTVEKNGACTKDFIQLDSISSIQVMRDVKHSGEGEDVHCMELTVTPRAKTHLIGSPGTTERRIWMQKLLESLTSIFPARLTADYTRAGWCFLKEGIGGEWMVSWILLNKRTLHYSQSNGRLKNVDLRKARSVGLQEGAACPRVSEEGPHILVDSTDQSVYLQMDVAKDTKSWRQTLKTAAVDNGPNLSDQQLSKNNIPVIVEKCINFVYAHGLMSEGIYRRCGANSNVAKLLSAFQTDAWSVQLSRQDYSEYDVANVLKRFFRELPEPVFTAHLHKHLCNTAVLKCTEEEKLSIYRTQLEQLPTVNYLTIRLLLSHLYALHQQRERNLMPIKNLAAIWAPTLMHVESVNATGEVNWSRQESEVIGELIALYPKLFMVDDEELSRERRMQEVLERYHNSSSQQQPQVMAPAGDLRIWIHIGSKDSTNCVQVTVNPLRLSGDICAALSDKLPQTDCSRLCLVETVLDGALTRPLHHSERVLESVLRWSYWDDVDCKNNCLVLTENTLFQEVVPLAKQAVPKSGELKFADLKSKSFKTYVFEFSQAKLSYYKDKSGSCKLGEWRIEDISWYLGHEPKRNPQMRWSITFVSKNNKPKRCKETPFFGCTIAGPSREEQLKWIAAMLLGEYPHSDLLPPPKHVNLME